MFFPAGLNAQPGKVPLLERSVSLVVTNERLADVLVRVGKEADFTFSYKASLINADQRINAEFHDRTVRQILDYLFRGSVGYKERGKHIILIRPGKETASAKEDVVTGYVVDEATGQRLRNVSVYDPVTLSSAVTDDYGYFRIEIKNPTGEEIRLAVNKSLYADTIIVVPPRSGRLVNVPIRINKEKISTVADSVGSKLKRLWLATRRATQQAVNMENISDTMYRKAQMSFVPFAGSNGKLSGNVINDYSLNVLGGYSLGVRKAEFGGLFNIVRGDVTGVQAAGLFNGVQGNLQGVQVAGLANAVLGEARGPQFAGLVNFSPRGFRSFATAGLLNFTLGDAEGVGIAGLANFSARSHTGPQLAGLFNFSIENSGPVQSAGLFNFTAGAMRGVQLAGVFNFAARDYQGVQAAGVFNVAPNSIRGAQVSGVLNVAKYVQGTQIGLLNVSKNIKGVPVGLLSFVGKGYHKLEISADEVFYTNVAFRTGVRQFYNILTAGARPDTFSKDKTLWSFGYGVGTAPKLAKWLFLNVDVTSSQIVDGNRVAEIHLLNKLYTGFDFQVAKHFSITAGVTLNGLVTDSTYDQYPDIFTDYQPRFLDERVFSGNVNVQSWLGGKAGIRFF